MKAICEIVYILIDINYLIEIQGEMMQNISVQLFYVEQDTISYYALIVLIH